MVHNVFIQAFKWCIMQTKCAATLKIALERTLLVRKFNFTIYIYIYIYMNAPCMSYLVHFKYRNFHLILLE